MCYLEFNILSITSCIENCNQSSPSSKLLFDLPYSMKYRPTRLIIFSMKRFLATLLVIFPLLIDAQESHIIYYPNGQKAIEGIWQLSSQAMMPPNYLNAKWLSTSYRIDEPIIHANRSDMTGWGPWYGFPVEMDCEGLITTWYNDGSKRCEIHFENAIPNGPFEWLYKNGKTAMVGTLKDGMPSGEWNVYFPSGQLYYTGHFIPYTQEELLQRWQLFFGQVIDDHGEAKPDQVQEDLETANTDEALWTERVREPFQVFCPEMIAKRSGAFKFYREDGSKWGEVRFSDNIRDGKWTYWEKEPKSKMVLEYKNGKLISIEDATGKWTTATYVAIKKKESDERQKQVEGYPRKVSQKQLYPYPEEPARFPGDLDKYLKDSLQYPDLAKKANIEGRVVLSFTVNLDGSLSDPRITRSLGYGTNEEALRLIKNMPAWIPGRMSGTPVMSTYYLSVWFRRK